MYEGSSLPSVHPKFEVEIPIDGSKPLSKNPNTLISANNDYNFDEMGVSNESSMSFVTFPAKKNRPTGREATKHSDAVKFVIDNVV